MELHELTGATHDEILTVSAKTGEGVDDILDAIVTSARRRPRATRRRRRARSSSTPSTTSTAA